MQHVPDAHGSPQPKPSRRTRTDLLAATTHALQRRAEMALRPPSEDFYWYEVDGEEFWVLYLKRGDDEHSDDMDTGLHILFAPWTGTYEVYLADQRSAVFPSLDQAVALLGQIALTFRDQLPVRDWLPPTA